MEGYFTFQCRGGGCFSDRGASFLSEGWMGMGICFDGEGEVSKKIVRWGDTPHAPSLWETLPQGLIFLYLHFSKFGAESCPP